MEAYVFNMWFEKETESGLYGSALLFPEKFLVFCSLERIIKFTRDRVFLNYVYDRMISTFSNSVGSRIPVIDVSKERHDKLLNLFLRKNLDFGEIEEGLFSFLKQYKLAN